MSDEKLELMLNVSLSTPLDERKKTDNLNVGYDEASNTWELIVKYNGDIKRLEDINENINVLILINQYAIITVPENLIEIVSAQPEVEYVEKPKKLYYEIENAKVASCIYQVQEIPYNLTGEGVIVGIIDSGIHISDKEFLNPDNTTRIELIWDQVKDEVYTREDINQAIVSGTPLASDIINHGNYVAQIAAGNSGVAKGADIMVVKLKTAREDGFPRTVEIMTAIDFIVRNAMDRRKPFVMNISIGNNYGSHDGTSLLETFINAAALMGKSSIVIGAGNEGNAAIHTNGVMESFSTKEIEFSVSAYETTLNIQVWKSYGDEMQFEIITPKGEVIGPIVTRNQTVTFNTEDTVVIGYYGEPSPYSMSQEIYFDFIPTRDYIESGIWRIRITSGKIVEGRYDMWMPSEAALNQQTFFLQPSPDTTLTIPSTSFRAVSVGAYDAYTDSYGDFSGRGYTRMTNQIKPDIVAPGKNIIVNSGTGGTRSLTGTSFAAPFVTGSVALLMEWGIVRGNDEYLYGEKVKSYLIKGARPIPGEVIPSRRTGWGALCVRDSLPR